MIRRRVAEGIHAGDLRCRMGGDLSRLTLALRHRESSPQASDLRVAPHERHSVWVETMATPLDDLTYLDTTDPELISEWWESTPDANIGIRTVWEEDGLVTIDLDQPDATEASVLGVLVAV